ncbi:hypothetical protein ES288_A05G318000v1 [Gossypium darwinii]|uniref:Uncharacterized protein n=2 Tax=Gossypium TaxID=3633 RepID=A0A5D2QN12_GOSTO|nr:hypothetical protein ES288_A05G318000v1 [Gossypium darwinii]TYI29502.1 hypothetical protein ES332_A05G320400v1 [Gossypium tomentosum]
MHEKLCFGFLYILTLPPNALLYDQRSLEFLASQLYQRSRIPAGKAVDTQQEDHFEQLGSKNHTLLTICKSHKVKTQTRKNNTLLHTTTGALSSGRLAKVEFNKVNLPP